MSTANPYTELTQQTREDLVLEHAPQIKRIVTRMAARFPPGVDQEELYQAGMMGLLDALEKWDNNLLNHLKVQKILNWFQLQKIESLIKKYLV